jgi:hypothetical protein
MIFQGGIEAPEFTGKRQEQQGWAEVTMVSFTFFLDSAIWKTTPVPLGKLDR